MLTLVVRDCSICKILYILIPIDFWKGRRSSQKATPLVAEAHQGAQIKIFESTYAIKAIKKKIKYKLKKVFELAKEKKRI
jgi:hypothetical protein